MLHLLGFISLEKFRIFEVHDDSVSQGVSNIFYLELDVFFGLLLYWALGKTERNESSNVTLH